jgi:hypothetical protein
VCLGALLRLAVYNPLSQAPTKRRPEKKDACTPIHIEQAVTSTR